MGPLATSRLGRGVARLLGVPRSTLDEMAQLLDRGEELSGWAPEVAATLGPLGWIPIASAPFEGYARAVQLVRAGDVGAAESLLCDAWDEGDPSHLRALLPRVSAIYLGPPPRTTVAHHRRRLLTQALDHHERGEYAAAISVVLAQIDGIVYDHTGEYGRSFFSRKGTPDHLMDGSTLPGHPRGLAQLARLFADQPRVTSPSGALGRNGILHGRELAYDNRVNSVKAFAALISVIEWAVPLGQEKSLREMDAWEQQHAGSEELDAFGHRLDRRGFEDAFALLHQVHLYQGAHFGRRGRYAATAEALFYGKIPQVAADLAFQLDADSRRYWASVVTPPGCVFGVAGEDGVYDSKKRFAARHGRRPKDGPGDAETWRGELLPAPYPEW